MHFGLTPEQEMVVSTVRGFVENELYPLETEVERTSDVPREMARDIQDKVLALGFYAPNMPAELGGGGLDTLTFTLLERELGRASWRSRSIWGRPSNILMACKGEQREKIPVARHSRRKDRRARHDRAGRRLRRALDEDHRAARRRRLGAERHQAFHQPRRRGGFRDRLRRDRRGGDDAPAPKKRITGFLVDRGTPGFEIRPGYQSRVTSRLPQLAS